MTKRKYAQLRIALLSILLFSGQLAVLTHLVEHQFHAHGQSCNIFIQCDNSDNDLNSNTLKIAIIAGNVAQQLQIHFVVRTFPHAAFKARAPPFFS